MNSEIQHRARFSEIRYAQCWEDSELLVAALHPAGRRCLSIGSAGDNSLALLAAGAAHVTAVEMNPAQVACIELRRAAYLTLDHHELLELVGSRPSTRRANHYHACRPAMPATAREFWDARPHHIANGIGGCGKFERYFATFRTRVLPIAHPRRRIQSLLEHRHPDARLHFHQKTWNNRRWRWIFQIFFSRTIMGALGRDPEFFRYVDGSVADRILARTRHALAILDPSANPYLHWILTGTHGTNLPAALEEKNFTPIRDALAQNKLAIVPTPIESLLANPTTESFDAYNLSDIFEYMSEANTAALLEKIAAASPPGARLAYWNMLAPRSRPPSLAHRLQPHTAEGERLLAQDRAFFYSKFIIEEVVA